MNFVSMYILVGILDITELAFFSSSLGVVGRLDAAFTEMLFKTFILKDPAVCNF